MSETKRPWIAGDGPYHGKRIYSETEGDIAFISSITKDDLALIVKAVNRDYLFDEIIKALKWAVSATIRRAERDLAGDVSATTDSLSAFTPHWVGYAKEILAETEASDE